MTNLGALFSGSYIFFGMIGFAFAQSQLFTVPTVFIAIIPAIAWVVLWLLRDRHRVQRLIPLPPMAAVGAVLLWPTGVTWPPIATLTFACALVAICMWPAALAALGILLSAIANYLGTNVLTPNTLLISTDFLDGWVTTIVALTLPTAMLVVTVLGRQTANRTDRTTMQALERQREHIQREQFINTRSDAIRHIHETYLNSLVALTDPDVDPASAQSLCSQELERTPSLPLMSELKVAQIAGAVAETRRVPVEFVPTLQDAQFSESDTARAFASALHESVANADRHANGCTGITVKIRGNDVEATVDDAGPGDPDRWLHGMGITHNIRDALSSVGGSAHFQSTPQGGSRVTLKVSLRPKTRSMPVLPTWDTLIDSRVLRLCLIPTVLTGLLFVPAAVSSLRLPGATLILFGVFLLAEIGLVVANRHNERLRHILIPTALAAGASTLLIAGSGDVTCESAIHMHWVMYSVAGGVLLPLVLLTSIWSRVIVYLMWTVVSISVALRWPQQCLIDPLGAAIEHLVWSSVIVALFFGFGRVYTRQQAITWNAWDEAAISDSRRSATATAEDNVRFASDLVKPAFQGVVDHRYRPGSHECQLAAQCASSLTRTYLNLITRLPEAPTHELRPLIRSLLEKSWRINTTFLHDRGDDSSTSLMVMKLLKLLTDFDGVGNVEILALEKSIIVSADEHVIDRIVSGSQELGFGVTELDISAKDKMTIEMAPDHK